MGRKLKDVHFTFIVDFEQREEEKNAQRAAACGEFIATSTTFRIDCYTGKLMLLLQARNGSVMGNSIILNNHV